MTKVLIHVEGMTCANCANTITRVLQKEGLKDVNVNYLTTEVTFEEVDPERFPRIYSQIKDVGYRVVEALPGTSADGRTSAEEHVHAHDHGSSLEKKFWWSVAFTVPLLAHMVLPLPFLHNPLVQLLLCVPVMFIGISYFGKSAWGSVKAGLPNMDVLIFIGSSAAFIYSVIGMYLYMGSPQVEHYLFFETAAAIICFVMLGNVLEHRSVKQTSSSLLELSRLQPEKAKRIVQSSKFKVEREQPGDATEVEEIELKAVVKGDLLMVATGDKVPVDGVVVQGTATVNESMITGESLPVTRSSGEKVIGGTIAESGSFTMKAEQVGNETTLAHIIRMVKDAQLSKPKIQKLGDRVSNIFVPAVLLIAAGTFLVSHFILDIAIRESIMRSIAVLVIACPCAMGLATPTALMVGIGRAARNGILIKGGNTVEQFSKVRTVVFDKTGTLTTGKFKIKKINTVHSSQSIVHSGNPGDEKAAAYSENEIKSLLYALELHSSHPIAKSIVQEFSNSKLQTSNFKLRTVTEDKGIGVNATAEDGSLYSAGSFVMARHVTDDDSHNIYLLKNNALIATVDLEDEIKEGTKETISRLKKAGIRTVLLSGDRKKVCERVATATGIDVVYSEQLPKQKLDIIERLSKENLTAMVGDGINDAPALSRADVGVSLSDASQVAIQSADVVLLHSHQLDILIRALELSRHTLLTIKQNLFWAFFYNVLAIPVAAAGFLSPAIGALSMAFSDVVLISNSIRLRFKKIHS